MGIIKVDGRLALCFVELFSFWFSLGHFKIPSLCNENKFNMYILRPLADIDKTWYMTLVLYKYYIF
jgi:hypothetical protein